MKSRDEFIESVMKKAEAAKKASAGPEIRRVPKKRSPAIRYAIPAAAACLILVIGITGFPLPNAAKELAAESTMAYDAVGDAEMNAFSADAGDLPDRAGEDGSSQDASGSKEFAQNPADSGSERAETAEAQAADGHSGAENAKEDVLKLPESESEDCCSEADPPLLCQIEEMKDGVGETYLFTEEKEIETILSWVESLPASEIWATDPEEFKALFDAGRVPDHFYAVSRQGGEDPGESFSVWYLTEEVTLPVELE